MLAERGEEQKKRPPCVSTETKSEISLGWFGLRWHRGKGDLQPLSFNDTPVAAYWNSAFYQPPTNAYVTCRVLGYGVAIVVFTCYVGRKGWAEGRHYWLSSLMHFQRFRSFHRAEHLFCYEAVGCERMGVLECHVRGTHQAVVGFLEQRKKEKTPPSRSSGLTHLLW